MFYGNYKVKIIENYFNSEGSAIIKNSSVSLYEEIFSISKLVESSGGYNSITTSNPGCFSDFEIDLLQGFFLKSNCLSDNILFSNGFFYLNDVVKRILIVVQTLEPSSQEVFIRSFLSYESIAEAFLHMPLSTSILFNIAFNHYSVFYSHPQVYYETISVSNEIFNTFNLDSRLRSYFILNECKELFANLDAMIGGTVPLDVSSWTQSQINFSEILNSNNVEISSNNITFLRLTDLNLELYNLKLDSIFHNRLGLEFSESSPSEIILKYKNYF